jgi:DNA mismatch repair protein MutL
MPAIRILSPDLCNKIAAGEVVERPASVVKELLENSIDAGARQITVEVLQGGKRLIRVDDDGFGMDREDALLCFAPHATSKLSSEDDLFNVRTMGFRGEALPSIASISRICLTTAIKGARSGIAVEIEGGEVKAVKDSSAGGTCFEVRDLFYNTPVRKKFMRTDSTELFHIIDAVTKEALSHWQTGFALVSDNREIFRVPPASGPKERLLQIYGEEFVAGLQEIEEDGGVVSLKGLVSRRSTHRNMRSHQYLFINGRPVKNPTISHAVYHAYEGILPRDTHPVFFLFFAIDPRKVDVNVHPTKREVRLRDKEAIHGFVGRLIKNAVAYEHIAAAGQPESPGNFSSPVPYGRSKEYPFLSESPPSLVSEHLPLSYETAASFFHIGDTFIATTSIKGLVLIDHHAAHERVLYEKILKKIELDSFQLLFPKQVKLSPKEYHLLCSNIPILHDLAMEVEDFGNDTVIVRAVPGTLRNADIQGILSDVCVCLLKGVPPGKSIKEAVAATIACHSSVRGGRILNQEECRALLEQLDRTEYPDRCPHGRPTRIILTFDDLFRMFKRK